MWWRDGVLYQVYPRSFADSDGDGIGDLRGIIERLDHLQWLGVDGLWLNPTFPSPNADWGFDVSDYRGVHPDLGTLADLDALIAAAAERGIRVLLDLVPNHTSDQHPWFAGRPEYYVWAPGRNGGPPNNWRSAFGGSAWKLDARRGAWYLHNFFAEQPDLDWWNDAVRDEFDEILRFWFDRGVAGFRIDVAHGIVKDRELRDNPPAEAGDPDEVRWIGQRSVYNVNRPEVHDVLRRWRALCDARPEADKPILIGETWVHDMPALARFYGAGSDELHLAFNFIFVEAALEAGALAQVVADTEAALPERSWPVWALSNHDVERVASRWAHGDLELARCILLMQLTLRGTPVLYSGDELAMEQAEVPAAREQDPVGLLRDPDRPGRDGARTPMPWSAEPGAGFTVPGAQPWLPFGDLDRNVADQRADKGSPLHLARDLIALRRAEADLREGSYARVDAPAGVWAYRRGASTLVALNLGAKAAELAVDGAIAIATRRDRDGERVGGTLSLAPSEAVVVREN